MDSRLQIISGAHSGRKLNLPEGARPTQNIARHALFNILTNIVNTTNKFCVWDAFAGSGAFGLEFLSRYGDKANVVFTDNSDESVGVIKKNLKLVSGTATVRQCDAISVIPEFGTRADVIFIDPPYSKFDCGVKFIKKITPFAKPGVILVWEMEKIQEPEFSVADWAVLRDKTYGRAHFLILRKI